MSRARFSPGDEIFDLRFVTSLSLFFLLFFFSFHFLHSVRECWKGETTEIKRSLFLSFSLSLSILSCIRRRRSRLILLVTFFTCEQVSDLRANLSTSRGATRGQAGRQAGRASRAVLWGEPVPSRCTPKHEGGSSHLLLNLVKLARARARLCLTLVQVQVVGATQGRTLESTWAGRGTEREDGWEKRERRRLERIGREGCLGDRDSGTSVNIGNYMQSLVLLSLGN